MKSLEYWQERAKYLENRKYNMSASAMNNVSVAFDKAQAEIQKEIDVWFNRLAANNGISITEARKLLNKNELKEFHWDLETYIKYGQENAINQKWIKELENASAKFHISKFEALKMRTQQAYEKAFGGELDSIDKLMRDVYTDSFYRGSYELAKGIGIGHRIGGIDESKLNHVVKKPWAADGKNFSDRIWQRKNEMINTLHQELMRTCIMGKSPDDAIKTLTAFVGDSVKNAKYAASRLAYTEAAYAYAEGIKESYSIAEVEEYEYLATLDDRTSEICQEMDGKHFPMSEYSPGITAPPLHPNCRSVTVPYNDAIEKLIGDSGERAARDEDGNTLYVPGDMTYKDWYRQFVEGEKTAGFQGLGSKSRLVNIPPHKKPDIIGKIDYNNEDAVKSILTEFEAAARFENIETACVITKDGTVYKCYGVSDRVFPDSDLGDELKGAKVSHNHLINETVYTFSHDDLKLFIEYELELLRGCDEVYTYEFTRDKTKIDIEPENWMNEENYWHTRNINKSQELGIGYRRWKNEKS